MAWYVLAPAVRPYVMPCSQPSGGTLVATDPEGGAQYTITGAKPAKMLAIEFHTPPIAVAATTGAFERDKASHLTGVLTFDAARAAAEGAATGVPASSQPAIYWAIP